MISGLLTSILMAAAATPPAPGLSVYVRSDPGGPRWSAWGDDAVARARREGKPLFVLIGRARCRECRAADEAVFSDAEVRRLLETRFVAVRVDDDERPHVLARVRAGEWEAGEPIVWPVAVFLRPDGTLLGQHRFEAPANAEAFRAAAAAIADAPSPAEAALRDPSTPAAAARGPLEASVLEDARQRIESAPLPGDPARRLSFLLSEHRRTGSRAPLDCAAEALVALARSPMHDAVGGAFHLAPGARFEKRLADNALLLRAYAEAYGATKTLLFRNVAEGIAAWALREAHDMGGAFWTALADTGTGPPGAFYLWTDKQIAEALGADRAREFLAQYRVVPPGVLTLTGDPYAGLGPSREILFIRRARRIRPDADDAIVVAPNALMIAALCASSRHIDRKGDLDAARRAADDVLARLGPADALRHWARGPAAGGRADLRDHAFLADALLDLHEATGERRWLDTAKAVVDAAIVHFWDAPSRAFREAATADDPVRLGAAGAWDTDVPGANGTIARALLRLGRLTREARYDDLGQRLLDTFAADVRRAPLSSLALLGALQEQTAPPAPAPAAP